MSSHNVKEKPTNKVPVGESDLKTAKSVFRSLRPSKLSKLQHCRTTAEARMAPPRTAAYEGRLVSEIFREPVQFKGAVEAGSCHWSAAARSRAVTFLPQFDLPPCKIQAALPFSSSSGPPCLQAPSFYLLFLSFQGCYRAAVAVSSEQLVRYAGNITERVAMDKHRL